MAARAQSRKRDKKVSASPISDAATSLADVLRTSRLRQQLSQAGLAGKLGLRQRQISDLERGVVDARLSTIQNVARALDLELTLIPRQLLSAVEALQRSGDEDGTRPLYSLASLDEEEAKAPKESHRELGAPDAPSPSADEGLKRKGSRP